MQDREIEVPVQNAAREIALRDLFGLQSGGRGRIGPDAIDGNGNEYELKSTTTGSITTARDVGPHTLERWRTRYWICTKGRNTARGFIFQEIYFLAPQMLEEWIQQLEQRFTTDLQLLENALDALERSEWRGDVERLQYLVMRGLTVNNPKIPWAYVQTRGIRITEDYPGTLRTLVAQNPVPKS